VAEGHFGNTLTELSFARYTKKMWNLDLEELPASLLRRLPIRYNHEDGYFTDSFQAMPKDGSISLFTKLLDHPQITVQLSTVFAKNMEAGYDHVFNRMPIYLYFDECYGPLPYRSIHFETSHDPAVLDQQVPTLNFTDEGPHTRIPCWDLYPGCAAADGQPSTLCTRERPCNYANNNFERYYPVKTVDGLPQQR
jgi:UDP-galactopyranose mutase